MKKTIVFEGVKLSVTFDYQQEESPEIGIHAKYPGCKEEIQIEEVNHKSQDIFSLFNVELTEKLEAALLKQMEDERNDIF
jgi:hypothetical protein